MTLLAGILQAVTMILSVHHPTAQLNSVITKVDALGFPKVWSNYPISNGFCVEGTDLPSASFQEVFLMSSITRVKSQNSMVLSLEIFHWNLLYQVPLLLLGCSNA